MHRLIKGFIVLAENGQGEKNVMRVFISQKSIIENFKKVFLVHNESLSLRFYNLLSRGVSFNRVYLPTYLQRLTALFSNEITEQMYFVFCLYDSDFDGRLDAKDISDIMTNVLSCPKNAKDDIITCECIAFKEVDII